MGIDWTSWILEKNTQAKEESLKKSDFVHVEFLEKAKNGGYSVIGSSKPHQEGEHHGGEVRQWHEIAHNGKHIGGISTAGGSLSSDIEPTLHPDHNNPKAHQHIQNAIDMHLKNKKK